MFIIRCTSSSPGTSFSLGRAHLGEEFYKFPAAMTRKALTDHLPVKLLKEANSFVVLPTGADFGSAGGTARKSVGGIGRKRGNCGPWGPVGEGEECLCSLGAPEIENPTRRLHLEAISCMSPVGREIKMGLDGNRRLASSESPKGGDYHEAS